MFATVSASSTARAPDLNSAWMWFLELFPERYHGFIFIAVIILIATGFILRLLGSYHSGWVALRNWFGKKQDEIEPMKLDEIPKPKVSFWNVPYELNRRPKKITNSIPIVTVAAMKGGVGKTTLTANLAAYFNELGKSVLLIDLDYQGSLSNTVTAAANISRLSSEVQHLFDENYDLSNLLSKVTKLGDTLPNVDLLTCYYQFSDVETNAMINWITAIRLGKSPEDIRFRLEMFLHSDEVQDKYDIVLIDAPPRFTAGTINALCASTHLLVPTVLDRTSAEAAVFFSQDLAGMRQTLFPDLKLMGVIPTLTYQNNSFTRRENDLMDYLNDSLQSFWGRRESVLKHASIPRKNAIGDVAGNNIGFLDAGTNAKTKDVQSIFIRVGSALLEHLENEQQEIRRRDREIAA